MRDAPDASVDDLLRVANHLPIQGSVTALNEEQRSYLLAAARRYGVTGTWKALSRAIETGDYCPDEIVRITWSILKKQRAQSAGGAQ